MTLYTFALFFHIVGILGLCISVALEAATVFRLRAAQTTVQVQEWILINRALEKILPISALLVLASGLYMTFTTWGWGQAWIDLSLGMLITVGVLGAVINGPRMKAIEQALHSTSQGLVSDDLKQRINDSVLWLYAQIPAFMALGAIVLMTLKLNWLGSIVVLIVALVVGLISGRLAQGTRIYQLR